MARALAISSHVVRGHVGLNATVPALQALGHEVWALPTVVHATRPGLGQLAWHELPVPDLLAILGALEGDGCATMIDAVCTGYFPSAAAVQAAAQVMARLKSANPALVVLVDPVLGDAGRLYVAPDTAEAIRDALLPLADVATPNLFELEWLTGAATNGLAEVIGAARRLGPATVVVTSAAGTADRVSTLLVSDTDLVERALARRPGVPNGAGDLFAGLFLGHLLDGRPAADALDAGLAALDRVLAESAGKDVLILAALHGNGQ
jgi:pyridoxine kinase